MRVIGGIFRGRRLNTPTWAGLRPTSDRLRETLFNILGDSVRGARVLDGFAGTGANGLEALSRGAAHATFIEQDPRAARLIETNLSALGVGENDRAIIRAGFAEAARLLAGRTFDLVVLDPPYATSPTAAIAEAAPLVGPSARLVIEHAARETAPDAAAGLQRRRTVTAGDSALSFYEHS